MSFCSFNALLGKKIKTLRKKRGLNQIAVAEYIGVHQTALCRVEKGMQSLTPEQLVKVSEFLGVTIQSFFKAGE